MKEYERREVAISEFVLVKVACNGCGAVELDTEPKFFEVTVTVDDDDTVMELDYCPACLAERLPEWSSATG